MYAYIVIAENGEITTVKKNKKDVDLCEVRKVIGCDTVEVVRLKERLVMLIDEDGKFKRSGVNLVATALYSECIVGNAVVMQVGGDLENMTMEQAHELEKGWKRLYDGD